MQRSFQSQTYSEIVTSNNLASSGVSKGAIILQHYDIIQGALRLGKEFARLYYARSFISVREGSHCETYTKGNAANFLHRRPVRRLARLYILDEFAKSPSCSQSSKCTGEMLFVLFVCLIGEVWCKHQLTKLPTMESASGVVTQLQSNSGIRFVPMSDIILTNSKWKLYLRLDYLHICDQSPHMMKAVRTRYTAVLAQLTRDKSPDLKGFSATYNLTNHLLNDVSQNCDFLTELRDASPRRGKRDAFLPIGGRFLQSIFGVATGSEVDEVKRDLADVNQILKNFTLIQEKQLSFVNSTTTLLEKQAVELVQLQSAVQFDQQKTLQVLESLKNVSQLTLAQHLLSGAQLLAETYHRQLERINEILLSAAASKLHPQLLPPAQLKKELVEIERRLPKGYSLHISIAQLHHYYTENYLATFSTKTGFDFLLRIPLKHDESSFNLYAARPLPTEIVNSSFYGFIVNTPPYIAISEDQRRYIELTETDLQYCTTATLKTCSLTVPIRTFDTPSCLSAVYMADDDNVQEMCERRITRYPTTTAVKMPHSQVWILSLSHPMRIQLKCANINLAARERIFSRQTYEGIIALTLPQQCEASGDDFLLPTHFDISSGLDWTAYKKENIPMLQASLFGQEHLNLLTGVKTPEKTEIPTIIPASKEQENLMNILDRYGKRAKDFDDLRVEIDQTKDNVFASSSAFVKHVTRQATWLTITTSVGVTTLVIVLSFGFYVTCQNIRANFLHFRRRPTRRQQPVDEMINLRSTAAIAEEDE